MRIGSLSDVRRKQKPGVIPVNAGASLEAQVADLYATLSVPKVWLDPSLATTRFQDFAAATLVTSDGQPFARLNDRAGSCNVGVSVAASMPLWKTDGSLSWAQPDGTDDFWQSLSNLDLSGTNKATIVAGVQHGASPGASCLFGLGSAASLAGSFEALVPVATNGAYRFGMGDGTLIAGRATDPVSAPRTMVLIVEYDRSQATTALQIKVEINGVAPTLTDSGPTNAGTSNFISAVLNFFRRNATSNPFTGRMYGFQLIGRLLSADEKTLLRRYMASKTGISL